MACSIAGLWVAKGGDEAVVNLAQRKGQLSREGFVSYMCLQPTIPDCFPAPRASRHSSALLLCLRGLGPVAWKRVREYIERPSELMSQPPFAQKLPMMQQMHDLLRTRQLTPRRQVVTAPNVVERYT
jgi:hypothetical protein